MTTKTSVTAIVLLLSLCALSITQGQTSFELQELRAKGRMSPSLVALVIKKKETVQQELDRTTNLAIQYVSLPT